MKIPVESSNIRAVEYDLGRQILEVDFHNGSSYRYSNVVPDIYAAFMDSPSKGSYLASVIKSVCPVIKVDQPRSREDQDF